MHLFLRAPALSKRAETAQETMNIHHEGCNGHLEIGEPHELTCFSCALDLIVTANVGNPPLPSIPESPKSFCKRQRTAIADDELRGKDITLAFTHDTLHNACVDFPENTSGCLRTSRSITECSGAMCEHLANNGLDGGFAQNQQEEQASTADGISAAETTATTMAWEAQQAQSPGTELGELLERFKAANDAKLHQRAQAAEYPPVPFVL